jgi:hypothetical protein
MGEGELTEQRSGGEAVKWLGVTVLHGSNDGAIDCCGDW